MKEGIPAMNASKYRLTLGGIAIVAATIGTVTVGTEQAHADQHWTLIPATSEPWVQPYGGCDESMLYADSPGAQDCRDHGWTVTRHIVLDPQRFIRALDMPGCEYEDGSGGPLPCLWIGSQDGNGIGKSYWISRSGRTHYVRNHR